MLSMFLMMLGWCNPLSTYFVFRVLWLSYMEGVFGLTVQYKSILECKGDGMARLW
jgi:hypothetical protein